MDEGPDSDQPHTHTEDFEPEDDASSEEEGSGAGVKTAKPAVVIGGRTSSLRQCVSHNAGLVGSAKSIGGPDFNIRLSEGFQSSFVNGARFRIIFNNIGAGVGLFLPSEVPLEAFMPEEGQLPMGYNKPLPSGPPGYRPGKLILVPSDAGGHAMGKEKKADEAAVSGLTQVTVQKRTGWALYEVTDSEPSPLKGVIKKATINVYVAFIANTAQNLPGLCHVSFVVAFAPRALAAVNQFRFEMERTAFAIISCTQSLLFSFVTNQDGYDTAITISNTSLDPMGTSPQAGSVTLYYYGNVTGNQEGPKPQTSGTVGAGRQLVFTLSNGGNLGIVPTPGFQGYIIAITRFQYAYGVAFIDPMSGGPGHCYPAVKFRRE